MMRKIIFIVLLILGFSNCKNQNKKNEISEDVIIKKDLPVFIGLSPEMTEKEFAYEINILNQKGKLNEGKFNIPVKSNDFYFTVEKTNNTIRLSYFGVYEVSRERISYALSDKYLDDENTKINDFIEIFDSKYNGQRFTLPKNIDLAKYGLNKEYYNVYQDSSKTVLFGYDKFGDRYPSLSERDNEDKNKSFLETLGRASETEEQRNRNLEFGFVILIDYYHNEDFNKLFKKMQSDSIFTVEKGLKKVKRKTDSKERFEENLKDL